MVFYKQNDFYVNDTNIPVKLERPEGHIPMTKERFDYIVSMQAEWRKQYLLNKKQKKEEDLQINYEKKYIDKGLPIPKKRKPRGRPSLLDT